MRSRALILTAALLSLATFSHAAVLEVGADKPFSSIQAAVKAAHKGDEISVFGAKKATFYDKTAILVKTPGLHIHAANPDQPIAINGSGFDYSGSGATPRAIFQFNPGADGCTLEGFDLAGAHNDSHNGAGVRINAANDITIRHCTIHKNDMGIMSNGDVKNDTGARQLIESCLIEKNGDFKEPGQNHNLYLGGTSVTVRGCEIAFSLTGHNLKSRAHHNWIEYNFIHDSTNRELDLVDGQGNTDAPDSDSVLLGNIIRKAPHMKGNKAVIQFGKDAKADHTGTLWLVHNTIATDYASPIIDLSAPGATAILLNNLIAGTDAKTVTPFKTRDGAKDPQRIQGNLFTFEKQQTAASLLPNPQLAPWNKIGLPWEAFGKKPEPLLQYAADRAVESRPATSPGPGAAGPAKQ